MVLFERNHTTVNPIVTLRRIGAGSAQDGAAARQNTAHRVEGEGHAPVLDDASPAFHEADKFVFVGEDALAHYGANNGIQARTITSAGQHTNLHGSAPLRGLGWKSLGCTPGAGWVQRQPQARDSAVAGKNQIIIKRRGRFILSRLIIRWRRLPVKLRFFNVLELLGRASQVPCTSVTIAADARFANIAIWA